MEEIRVGFKRIEKTSKFDLRRTHGGQIPTQIPFLLIETFRGDNMRRLCSRVKPCTTCCVSGCQDNGRVEENQDIDKGRFRQDYTDGAVVTRARVCLVCFPV